MGDCRLTLDLNAAAVPSRDANGWKKVWADYKNHIKVKRRRNKSGISGTGGGPSNFCSLTPQEQQVSDLLSIHVNVNGLNGTMEQYKLLSRNSTKSPENCWPE